MSNINRLFCLFICLVSAPQGGLFGYDWVVIGGAKPFYEIYFGITGNPGLQGLVHEHSARMGVLSAASAAGILADRIGRRALLIVAAAIFPFRLATGLPTDSQPSSLPASRVVWNHRQ